MTAGELFSKLRSPPCRTDHKRTATLFSSVLRTPWRPLVRQCPLSPRDLALSSIAALCLSTALTLLHGACVAGALEHLPSYATGQGPSPQATAVGERADAAASRALSAVESGSFAAPSSLETAAPATVDIRAESGSAEPLGAGALGIPAKRPASEGELRILLLGPQKEIGQLACAHLPPSPLPFLGHSQL